MLYNILKVHEKTFQLLTRPVIRCAKGLCGHQTLFQTMSISLNYGHQILINSTHPPSTLVISPSSKPKTTRSTMKTSLSETSSSIPTTAEVVFS